VKNIFFRKILFTLITAVLIFLTIYLINDGHNLVIENKVVDDIFSAVISIILGALVTMTLLYAQTLNEDSQSKASEIFKEKLRVYRDFLSLLGEFTKDGKLDKGEIKLLILQHALININMSHENQLALNNAISKIKDDLFFEDENWVPDYEALGKVFNEIAGIFKADLYGQKISVLNTIDYSNFSEISNVVRTKTTYLNSFDEFLNEIIPGREIFFTVTNKDGESKSYKFKIKSDASDHYRLAFNFAQNLIESHGFNVQIKFELAYKKLYQSIAISNPKILFLINDMIVMRIGISNRNNVILQLRKDEESKGTFTLDPLDDSPITNLNISQYVSSEKVIKHLQDVVEMN